jgi:DNA-binding response OmpR family regulator
MNVLVTDKDISISSSMVQLIRKWGYQAERSVTALETLEKVKEKPFDLVLLDMALPDMKPKELIAKLKALTQDIGIVTMTETNTNGQEKEIRTMGIVYYMIKPVSETVLKEILDHISSKKHRKVG